MNKNFHKAKKAKNDEFYTQLTDVEKEIWHYRKHFKGKVVFCNCDDPQESNFWKYFAANFEFLGLKKLISTHYEQNGESSYKLEIVRDVNGDGKVNNLDTIKTPLTFFGDFRSPECVEILKEADIVVTNPPFSLFREYIALLVEHKKKFIVVGNKGAVCYKNIFKLIKENKLWLGYTMPPKFVLPNGDIKAVAAVWYTNINTKKRNEDIILYKKYKGNEADYPKYDNYNAINVDKVADIPMDYKGVMGVPITFLNKFNPEQFEIVGLGSASLGTEIGVKPYKEEHRKYRKEVQKRAVVNGDLYMVENGIVKVPYTRIIIKRK